MDGDEPQGKDKEDTFVDTVRREIDEFVRDDIKNGVLVFPAFSSRLRFLTHKLVEEEFQALSTLSVGKSDLRRTTVYFKSRLSFLPQCPRMQHQATPGKTRPKRPDMQLYVPRGRAMASSPSFVGRPKGPSGKGSILQEGPKMQQERTTQRCLHTWNIEEAKIVTTDPSKVVLTPIESLGSSIDCCNLATCGDLFVGNKVVSKESEKDQRCITATDVGCGPEAGTSNRDSQKTLNHCESCPPEEEHKQVLSEDRQVVDKSITQEEGQSTVDSWDAMFDDSGECLDPSALRELTQALGEIEVRHTQLDYTKFEIPVPDLTEEEYGHILEIYDFPAEFETKDLVLGLSSLNDPAFTIKWVDDTHALAVFSSPFAASEALSSQTPLLKIRHVSLASKQSKLKVKRCAEFMQPFKPRPQTSASVARRLVSGALGLRVQVQPEQRRRELQAITEAKNRRREKARQQRDIWNGDVS